MLLLLAVVLQLSCFSQLGILGGHIDLVVLVVAAVAYYGGSVAGCATGFAAGFLLDLASGATMGVSSLVLTAVGYGVGRFREVRDPSHGLLPLAVGAAATGGFVVAFAAVSFMLDVGASVSPLVIRDAIVTTLLNVLLALPVFTGTRRLLRPGAEGRSARGAPAPPAAARDRPARAQGPGGLAAPCTSTTSAARRSRPQLAFRVAVIGGVALVMFAVIFFRLWYLQVLSGDNYVAAARENRVREIKVAGAARRDRGPPRRAAGGEPHTRSRSRSRPDKLPAEARRPRGGLPAARQAARAEAARGCERRVERELKALPYSKPTVKQDVDRRPSSPTCSSARSEFPGVEPEREFLRKYPHGADRRAPVRPGRRGEPEAAEGRSASTASSMGDRVGQAGIEAEYDRYLRGRNGAARVEVDALGNLTKTLSRGAAASRASSCGCRSTSNVQRVAQQALAGGTGRGAFAVMNVQNGEVLALGSQPSFDPNIFTKPISKKQLDALSSEDLGEPLFDRAIQGGYPTGSTFKLITADRGARERADHALHAAERPGLRSTVGGIKFENAGGVAHGVLVAASRR